MPFPESVIAEASALGGRRCSQCYKFCGAKIELHPLDPSAQEGLDSLENCIPLCGGCRAEAERYGPGHSRGLRFRPEELRKRRGRWYASWASRPPLTSSIVELSVDILRAEMRRTGEYVNCGKQYWRWVAWAEIRVNTSLPSLSINLYRCRTELKLPDKKRPLWGGEIGIDAAPKDKSLLDPIKLISSTLSGPVEVAIPEPRLARVASTFETPVWKRRSTDRAEARFRLRCRRW